jgi:ureidoacrylate peracid hydrolase
MNTGEYRKIIPTVQELLSFCRSKNIPIIYTEAVRETSGIDLLLNVHRILPITREERLKIPNMCQRKMGC